MINLSNFEQPQFATSQYILTSPRSLRACAKLNMKPIELLYKPLSEFEQQLKPLGTSDSSIYASFRKYDEERKEKLKRAKEERRKMKEREIQPETTKKKEISEVDSWRSLELVGEAIGTNDGSKTQTKTRPRTSSDQRRPKSSAGSSRASSRRSFIADQFASKSQSSIRSDARKSVSKVVAADIPERDLRILELMVARREEERALAEAKAAVSKEWLREKEKAAREQELMEQRYRESVIERNRHKKEIQEMKKLEREAQEREEIEYQRRLIENEASGWDVRAERIKERKIQKLEMKKLEEVKKKQLQEVKLQHLTQEDFMTRLSTQEQLEETLARAEEKRAATEKRRKSQLHEKNLKERIIHEQLKTAIKQNEEEDLTYVRASIAQKHARAEVRALAHQAIRDDEIRANRLKQTERERERRATVEKLQEDVEDWKVGVALRQKAALEKAEIVVAKGVEERARVAHEQRMAREQEHRRKAEMLRREEEERRRYAEREVQLKDMRSQTVMREKEAEVRKSREIARASEQLRMKILGSNRVFGPSKSSHFKTF